VTPPINILLVSRSFFHEACRIFFSEHTFILDLDKPVVLLRGLIMENEKKKNNKEREGLVARDLLHDLRSMFVMEGLRRSEDERLLNLLGHDNLVPSSS
jgi:hypothetical protein